MALYDKLVSPADTSDMPDDVARDVPANGMKFIAANGLQNAGDQVINPKTVLPWLLTAQGAPGLAIALLVPVRESLSMLPQAALTPWVKRRAHRKSVWILGSITQGVMALIMALSAASTAPRHGHPRGAGVFMGRSLCSIGSKDVRAARSRRTSAARSRFGDGLSASSPSPSAWASAGSAAMTCDVGADLDDRHFP